MIDCDVVELWRLILEKVLATNDIKKLREANLLGENETALIVGDLVVAENVISKERRVLEVGKLMLEGARQLLRD